MFFQVQGYSAQAIGAPGAGTDNSHMMLHD